MPQSVMDGTHYLELVIWHINTNEPKISFYQSKKGNESKKETPITTSWNNVVNRVKPKLKWILLCMPKGTNFRHETSISNKRYVHEIYVGLSNKDGENFICHLYDWLFGLTLRYVILHLCYIYILYFNYYKNKPLRVLGYKIL